MSIPDFCHHTPEWLESLEICSEKGLLSVDCRVNYQSINHQQALRGYITRTLGFEFPGLHNPDLETECYNPELGPSSGYITQNSSSSGLYTRFIYRTCLISNTSNSICDTLLSGKARQCTIMP